MDVESLHSTAQPDGLRGHVAAPPLISVTDFTQGAVVSAGATRLGRRPIGNKTYPSNGILTNLTPDESGPHRFGTNWGCGRCVRGSMSWRCCVRRGSRTGWQIRVREWRKWVKITWIAPGQSNARLDGGKWDAFYTPDAARPAMRVICSWTATAPANNTAPKALRGAVLVAAGPAQRDPGQLATVPLVQLLQCLLANGVPPGKWITHFKFSFVTSRSSREPLLHITRATGRSKPEMP
jgi:hypothetical protein